MRVLQQNIVVSMTHLQCSSLHSIQTLSNVLEGTTSINIIIIFFIYNVLLFVYQIFLKKCKKFYIKKQIETTIIIYIDTIQYFALIKVLKSVLLCVYINRAVSTHCNNVNNVSVALQLNKRKNEVDVCVCTRYKFTLSNTISTLHWRSTCVL